MSERGASDSRDEPRGLQQERAPYLYVVGRQGGETMVPRPEEDAGARAVVECARQAEALSQALMYACVSWVALVREETAQRVDLRRSGSCRTRPTCC